MQAETSPRGSELAIEYTRRPGRDPENSHPSGPVARPRPQKGPPPAAEITLDYPDCVGADEPASYD